MNKQKKAFTLVELIVVITILAILGTIAFISLNGYSKTARDSTRISDLSTMKTSLELFNLDAGKYPNTTDSFNITYSGVTIWTQGEFGQTTTNNVDRLDKVPTDPLTERKYTYSITKTKQEYQLAGLLEGDDVVLNLTEEVNAGDLVATAIVTGNYNGMMIKTLTGGINCEILAIPSIISNQANSVTQLTDILTNTGLVYNGESNLPSNYISSKFKVDEGFDFSPNQLVVYSDSNSCNPIYDEDDTTARTTLITNLQTSYTGTVIANEGVIAEITTADSGEIEAMASVIVNNNLGGEIAITNSIDSISVPSGALFGKKVTKLVFQPYQANSNVSDSTVVFDIDNNLLLSRAGWRQDGCYTTMGQEFVFAEPQYIGKIQYNKSTDSNNQLYKIYYDDDTVGIFGDIHCATTGWIGYISNGGIGVGGDFGLETFSAAQLLTYKYKEYPIAEDYNVGINGCPAMP